MEESGINKTRGCRAVRQPLLNELSKLVVYAILLDAASGKYVRERSTILGM
jgi:hypothetical protein